MKGDNYESILALAADSYTIEETFSGNGKNFTCEISTAIQTSVIGRYQHNLKQREKTLEVKKDIPVTVPIAVIQGREELFPDWKEEKDGKASFPLTKSEEVLTATTLEVFVSKPQFTFAEAVVFGRINGAIALKIQAKIIKWLTDEGLIESKND